MSTPIKRGTIIAGRYRLGKPLGEGGIGVVWEAWQVGIERRVAVKFLKLGLDAELMSRFNVEARALGRLNHPNCVTVHDFGRTEDGVAYLVMEFLEGEPATVWRGRRLSTRDIVDVGKQIATALAYAHHQGVVHRDLKPENVFVVKEFSGGTLIKVLDFGLAKISGRDLTDVTKTGQVFGTPAYMSPEQLRGSKDAGPPADLYSLGVMLYELIEQRLPFWDESAVRLGIAHITKPVPPMRRDGLNPQLANIVRTLLAKDPAERYPDALTVFDALDAVDAPKDDSTLQIVSQEPPRATLSRLPSEFAHVPADGTTEPRLAAEMQSTDVEPRAEPPVFAPTEKDAVEPLELDERVLAQVRPTGIVAPVKPPTRRPDRGSRVAVLLIAVSLIAIVAMVLAALRGPRVPTDTNVADLPAEHAAPAPVDAVEDDLALPEDSGASKETEPVERPVENVAGGTRATEPDSRRRAETQKRRKRPPARSPKPVRVQTPSTNEQPAPEDSLGLDIKDPEDDPAIQEQFNQ